VTHRLVTSTGLALSLLLAPGWLIHSASAQRQPDNRVPSYTNDTQQLGYEHGYRDGADRGRQDRDRGAGRRFSNNDYVDSARYSYDPSYGNRGNYMSGYQQGYQAGYDDGFNYYERPGKYGQVYGRGQRQGQGQGPGPRANERPFDSGYREGVAAGQQDVQRNQRSDFRGSQGYRNGDPNYKDGFERGYQDGYGRSRYQQDGGGYFPNRGNSGPADTRDGVGPSSRTITVPATQQWTPTGIRVNQGDRIQIQASGQITLRPNDARDVAIPAGSLLQRFAPNSPLPKSLAGALLGRIDSGQPFGIGNQTSIVAPGSGLLYLGVNDDVLADNSGQFQVAISW
jgi:hypothetical protein